VVRPRFTDAISLSKSGRATRVKLANLTVKIAKSPVKITAVVNDNTYAKKGE
jgi:hypothetical protein